MLISSLEKMEEIVKKNKNLMWDGWDVIHFYPNEKARTSKFGMRINNRWCISRRYSLTEKGWELPGKMVK